MPSGGLRLHRCHAQVGMHQRGAATARGGLARPARGRLGQSDRKRREKRPCAYQGRGDTPDEWYVHDWKERVVKRMEGYEQGPGVEPTGQALTRSIDTEQSFVKFFMQASSYIMGHRGKTFVVVVPGEAFEDPDVCEKVLDNLALLHALRVRVVAVLGCFPQMQQRLSARGTTSQFHGGYRITDPSALVAAMESAGMVRSLAEARLSKGPSVKMVRRHQRTMQAFHFRPEVQVSSGNFVVAKRRGIVDGVDFGQTGEVRYVWAEHIEKLLAMDSMVLVSNLGSTASGHVLNCNLYEVATSAAIALQADKMIFFTLNDIERLDLPRWLKLQDAESLIRRFAYARIRARLAEQMRAGAEAKSEGQHGPGENGDAKGAKEGAEIAPKERAVDVPSSLPPMGAVAYDPSQPGAGGGIKGRAATPQSAEDVVVDLDSWFIDGVPWELSCAVSACRAGVKRAHLVDIRDQGGLLLELYTRDGIGTMISRDFYEGCRPARADDLEAIAFLLDPLMKAGVLAPRTLEQIAQEIQHFHVIERDARTLACASLVPLGEGMAEIGAFVVDPKYRWRWKACLDRNRWSGIHSGDERRGDGRGDALLEYLEQSAMEQGLSHLVLLTTRTADWFMQRGFQHAGSAHRSDMLPASRKARVSPSRNSQLYFKILGQEDEDPGIDGTEDLRALWSKGAAL